jgi:hypothetical protein
VRTKQCTAMTPDGEGGYDYCIKDLIPRHGTHVTWEDREFEQVVHVRRRKRRRHKKENLGIVERASKNALERCGLTEWGAGVAKPGAGE